VLLLRSTPDRVVNVSVFCVDVCVQERMLGPKVLWVDVYGVDVASGARVHERIMAD
jgi:hypothetical protein